MTESRRPIVSAVHTFARSAPAPNEPIAPPCNIEQEQALLGAILINNEAFYLVAGFLEPRHFFEPLHKRIYDTAAGLLRAGKPATPIALKTLLPADIGLPGMTVSQYLARLAAEATTVINAADYARGIFNLSQVREFLAISVDLGDAHRGGADPEVTFRRALECVDELRAAGVEQEGTLSSAAAVVGDLMNHVTAIYSGTATDDALKTGLLDLDNSTGGLKRGELIVIAGRPGMGKTTFGGAIVRNAARLGNGVAFLSLEMASRPIMARILADQLFDEPAALPLTVNRILRAEFSPEEFDRMTDAARAIEALPLVIDDASQATIGSIYAKVRSVKRRFARQGKTLDLVVLDYLKFLHASERYAGQRHYEVGEITAGLKALAKEQNVAVLLLAQLNRQVEQRPDRRPQLSDLRESGDIEADADVVMFLFREAYYLQSDPEVLTDPEKCRRFDEIANTLEIIIAKQRMGAVGSVHAFVDLECSAVRDLDRRQT